MNVSSEPWQRSAAATALASVLEVMHPGEVTTRQPAPDSAILVCSYEEDFDDLWSLPDSMVRWLMAGRRHVVLVRHGQRGRVGPDASSPDWHLGPESWIVALTLAYLARAGAAADGNRCNVDAIAWRLTLLDLAPSEQRPLTMAAGGVVTSHAEQLAHVEVLPLWMLPRLFRQTREPPSTSIAATLVEDLRSWWRRAQIETPPSPGVTAEWASPSPLRQARGWAYRRALTAENSRFRHGKGDAFGACLPAVRMLLGGLQCGAVSPQRARHVLDEIRKRQPEAPDGREYAFALVEGYRRFVAEAGDPISSPGGRPSNKSGKRRRLLLIDDEHEIAGWDLVLPALFPGWSVDVGPPAWLDRRLNEDALTDYHLVLIDYFLGPDERRDGLHLLAALRERHPFIPAVLFTGVDDAALAGEALAAGATTYFVKELADSRDRDSEQYYRAFSELVMEVESTDRAGPTALVDTWRRLEAWSGTVPWDSATLDDRETRVAHVLTSFQRALLWWAVAAQGPRGRSDAHRAIGIALTSALKSLDHLAGVSEPTNLKGARRFAKDCRHGKALPEYNTEHVRQYFTAILEYLDTVLRNAGWPAPNSLNSSAFQSLAFSTQQQSRSLPADADTHRGNSVSGALRFILGYYATRGLEGDVLDEWAGLRDALLTPTGADSGDDAVCMVIAELDARAPERVAPNVAARVLLFVDDTGAEDGWLEGLRTALWPGSLVHFIRYDGHEHDQRVVAAASKSHLVVLDLRLPEAGGSTPQGAVGRELLRVLRHTLPDVPVVVLSANDDALTARRCLHAGAVGFFRKAWRPLPRGGIPGDVGFYGDYFHRLSALLDCKGPKARIGPLRSACGRLARIGRYRTVQAPDQDFSSGIVNLIDFLETMAWLDSDPNVQWLHAKLGRLPAAWTTQDTTVPDAAGFLYAIVEVLLRAAIAGRRAASDAEIAERRSLGSLVDLAKQRAVIANESVIHKLRELVEIRNATHDPVRHARKGASLEAIIALAIELLPPIANALIEAKLRPRRWFPHVASEPRVDWKPLSIHGESLRTLLTRRSDALLRARSASQKADACSEDLKCALEDLAAKKQSLARAMSHPWQNERTERAAVAAQHHVQDAERRLHDARSALEGARQAKKQAAEEADAIRESVREHDRAFPDVPGLAEQRRWRAVKGWLEERAIEDEIVARGEPALPCCWPAEPLSHDLDRLAGQAYAESWDEKALADGLNAWIRGGSVEQAVALVRERQDRNQAERGSPRAGGSVPRSQT